MPPIARTVLAILLGYALVVILTTLGFLPFPGGVAPTDGGLLVTLTSTAVAVIAGLAGGYTAGALGRIRPVVSALIVAIPLVLESIWLLATRTPREELLFSAAGAVTLIGSTIAGGLLRELQLRRLRVTS